MYGCPNATSVHYGLNRLTEEHRKDSGGATVWRRQYAYDKVGNRTQLVKDDGSGDVTYDYSYNGLGQLTKVEWTVGSDDFENAYSYDANGNRAQRGQTPFFPVG